MGSSAAADWVVFVSLNNGDRRYYAPGVVTNDWTPLVSRASRWPEAEARRLAKEMDVQGRIVAYGVEYVRRQPPGR